MQITIADQCPWAVAVTQHVDDASTGAERWPRGRLLGKFDPNKPVEVEALDDLYDRVCERDVSRDHHWAVDTVRRLPDRGLAIKIVSADGGKAPHRPFTWPLPEYKPFRAPQWEPGDWVRCDGALVPCNNGLHALPVSEAYSYYCTYIGPDTTHPMAAYLAEYRGGAIGSVGKLLAREMRLLWPLFGEQRGSQVARIINQEHQLSAVQRLGRALVESVKGQEGAALTETQRYLMGALECLVMPWTAQQLEYVARGSGPLRLIV